MNNASVNVVYSVCVDIVLISPGYICGSEMA